MENSLESEQKPELSSSQTQNQESYAFLNHSTATLPNNLPPSVDDKPLARQKRKRTSAEDQAILEAAYLRNPKPDKAARQSLVEQVALGEKEVQIWFQNRRQSSRRKSRPLLPHEVVQYQLSRSAAGPGNNQLSEHIHNNPDTHDERLQEKESEHGLPRGHMSNPPVKMEYPAGQQLPPPSSLVSSISSPLTSSQNDNQASDPTEQSEAIVRPSAVSTSQSDARQAYLANRRSAPSLPPNSFSRADPPYHHNHITNAEPTCTLKKASSFIRLSMSFDGNATIATKDDTSPSPPRASQVMLSQGETGTPNQPFPSYVDPSSAPGEGRAPLYRSSSGRSRDSRAWEFWCDKDARSELESKAEKEASGSAADAIGLFRSASGRNILGAIPNKRNSLELNPESGAKRPKLDSAKSSLRRSYTSSGRMQGKPSSAKAKPKLKYSESAVSVYIPGNESDKENWSPERPVVTSREHSGHHVSGRKMLGERHDGVNRSPAKRGTDKGKRPAAIHLPGSENADPEADAELATFMRGGRKSASLSSEDDLDCVQGLLSLSQGNWR